MILKAKYARYVKEAQSEDKHIRARAVKALQGEAYEQQDAASYKALEAYLQTKANHYLIAFLRFCNFEYDKAEKFIKDVMNYKFTDKGAWKCKHQASF